jgi:hypothetical protein
VNKKVLIVAIMFQVTDNSSDNDWEHQNDDGLQFEQLHSEKKVKITTLHILQNRFLG